MSRLEEKFLQDYSLETLRDTSLTSPVDEDFLVYFNGQWINLPFPAFGRDFDNKTKTGLEETTGTTFVVYDSLTFNVADDSGANQYRVNIDFTWGLSSVSQDYIGALAIDNATVLRQIQIEAKDPNANQRVQNNLLYYANNLSQGDHTIFFGFASSSNAVTARTYESVIEVWRTR
jgi:hypothetical protein